MSSKEKADLATAEWQMVGETPVLVGQRFKATGKVVVFTVAKQ